jgi:hypothetical protein
MHYGLHGVGGKLALQQQQRWHGVFCVTAAYGQPVDARFRAASDAGHFALADAGHFARLGLDSVGHCQAGQLGCGGHGEQMLIRYIGS